MAAILNEAALNPFRVTELAHIRPVAEALRSKAMPSPAASS